MLGRGKEESCDEEEGKIESEERGQFGEKGTIIGIVACAIIGQSVSSNLKAVILATYLGTVCSVVQLLTTYQERRVFRLLPRCTFHTYR